MNAAQKAMERINLIQREGHILRALVQCQEESGEYNTLFSATSISSYTNGVSPSVVGKTLKQFVDDGLLVRYDLGYRVLWRLTDQGRAVIECFTQVEQSDTSSTESLLTPSE